MKISMSLKIIFTKILEYLKNYFYVFEYKLNYKKKFIHKS